jgi:hypothetical protein
VQVRARQKVTVLIFFSDEELRNYWNSGFGVSTYFRKMKLSHKIHLLMLSIEVLFTSFGT